MKARTKRLLSQFKNHNMLLLVAGVGTAAYFLNIAGFKDKINSLVGGFGGGLGSEVSPDSVIVDDNVKSGMRATYYNPYTYNARVNLAKSINPGYPYKGYFSAPQHSPGFYNGIPAFPFDQPY
jgi:hypothetical protein